MRGWRRQTWALSLSALASLLLPTLASAQRSARPGDPSAFFQTSDRCFPCHNGMTTTQGAPLSLGLEWRSSIMANSARDPYWQASVRRETLDHPPGATHVENECSVCHMPMSSFAERARGAPGEVFAHLPFNSHRKADRFAADGVSCSVCHQITPDGLGTPESFDGGFHIDHPSAGGAHPEYGPFAVTAGRMHVMRTSSAGFQPDFGNQIRSSELCASCHTLITEALDPEGHVIGKLNEQMPYQEWKHSAYRNERSCQSCHMPGVPEETPIAHVLGVPRSEVRHHVFVAANFFIQSLLAQHRDELAVWAEPRELEAAAQNTREFLQANSARLEIEGVARRAGRLAVTVHVENLTGHKLPTAYPARRAWLHFTVRDRNGQVVFESGALKPDGSIVGNDNDADRTRYEPHYREIVSPDQVQIYESILRDPKGGVTTGLLTAVGYLKDNRLLPRGFDKSSAPPEIAVTGDAAGDPAFEAGGDRIRYLIDPGAAPGPFSIDAELWYQPIGYRWAHNLDSYAASETRRFTAYYAAASGESAVVLARAHRSSGP